MKTQLFSFVLALLLAASSALKAQDRPDEYLGLPGDNLNLYAVMHLFQNSETLEGFERSLNDPETIINNLDLNGDNAVDYIMVYNYADGNIHTIVLRVALNENEQQDVAVFTVEKLRDDAVQIQLIGDEALYGANYIIEPMYDETPNPGYATTVTKKVKTRRNVTVVQTTYYEVASWPVIVYMYQPTYRVWRSAYRWGYYPVYWHPWTPHYYHYYYGYHYNWYDHYYAHYRPWKQPRSVHYRNVYYSSIRNYSPTVVVNINKGTYKDTYSRPEKRSEGERVYAHRQSTGSNLPGRSSVGAAEGRQGSRPTPDVNERGTRSVNEGRTREVRDLRTGSSRNETASPGRSSRSEDAQRTTAPRREDARPIEKKVNRSSREQAAPPRNVEPTRTSRPASPKKESTINSSKEKSSSGRIERPKSAEPKKSVTRSAPASSKKESRSAVERSKPAKSESRTVNRVKTQERNSSNKSAGKVESKSSGSRKSSTETKSSNKRSGGR
ncbi:MAG: hypothetical protein IH597_11480 [Bacteroidales bacterium]|nr:hypothetical protein [Bacteroidales bacterium]